MLCFCPRSSGAGLMSVPTATTKHGEAAFSYSAPNIWKKLPENCRSAETLNAFKSRLKTFMLLLLFMKLLFLHCTVTFILVFYNFFYSVLAVLFPFLILRLNVLLLCFFCTFMLDVKHFDLPCC